MEAIRPNTIIKYLKNIHFSLSKHKEINLCLYSFQPSRYIRDYFTCELRFFLNTMAHILVKIHPYDFPKA